MNDQERSQKQENARFELANFIREEEFKNMSKTEAFVNVRRLLEEHNTPFHDDNEYYSQGHFYAAFHFFTINLMLRNNDLRSVIAMQSYIHFMQYIRPEYVEFYNLNDNAYADDHDLLFAAVTLAVLQMNGEYYELFEAILLAYLAANQENVVQRNKKVSAMLSDIQRAMTRTINTL